MARFEIDPTKPTPITPEAHTVDVGEPVVWEVREGAGIIEFAGAPEPVHFMKKDAQPGSPAIAIATHKGARRDFEVVFTVAPHRPVRAGGDEVFVSEREAGGEAQATAPSTQPGGGIARLRARIIIR